MPTLHANGVDLFYDLHGPEDAPVVAFSNSLGTTLEMWDAQVRALGGRYRCLRYDTRGHGRSAVVDRPLSIDDLAHDLVGLLDGLGIADAHVVGLSLGGMIAQAFAVKHPERVQSLVLMSTAAHLPPPEAWRQRAATVRSQGMAAIVDAVMDRWFTPSFREASPAVIEDLRGRLLAIDPRGYAACCDAIQAMDLLSVISSIGAPTLIIAGADDPATPVALMEAIRSRIADAEFLVIPRAAHLVNIERAELVSADLVAFLDRAARVQKVRSGGSTFETGLANRKSVLGVEHVQRSLDRAGLFATPWQDFITRTAWGDIWGDPALPWKTRSIVTLALMVALNREDEFKLHVRPALNNGVTVDELRALLLQTAVYAGVPAANAAFRWVKDVLGDEVNAGA